MQMSPWSRVCRGTRLSEAHLVQITFIVMKHEHVECTQRTLQSHATVQSLNVEGALGRMLSREFLIFGPFFNGEASVYAIENGTRVVSGYKSVSARNPRVRQVPTATAPAAAVSSESMDGEAHGMERKQ